MTQKFIGTGVALVTPFDKKLAIDFEGLQKLLNFTAKGGVNYFVVHGTTGESATTTQKEKEDMLAFIIAHNPKNLPIVYSLGGNSTSDILKKIDGMDFQGVDAVLSVSPYYNKPSQEGILYHYKVIADACPVPLLLYNVPSRTGSNISAKTTLQLAEHPNIIGIKEASGDLVQCIEIAKHKPQDFLLISGNDVLTVPMIAIGGVGAISVLANGFPKEFQQMVRLALVNSYTEAQHYVFQLLALDSLMYKEGNPVGIKQVLARLALCKNYVRPPLVEASTILTKAINTTLASVLK